LSNYGPDVPGGVSGFPNPVNPGRGRGFGFGRIKQGFSRIAQPFKRPFSGRKQKNWSGGQGFRTANPLSPIGGGMRDSIRMKTGPALRPIRGNNYGLGRKDKFMLKAATRGYSPGRGSRGVGGFI